MTHDEEVEFCWRIGAESDMRHLGFGEDEFELTPEHGVTLTASGFSRLRYLDSPSDVVRQILQARGEA